MMVRFLIYSVALAFCFSLLAFAPTARAVDGVVLINQATSTNGLPGCAHAGFPIVICKSGSYRLSGDLSVAGVDTTAIEISASDVTLDLNGFGIIGPVTCQPGTYPVACSAHGGGIGIYSFGSYTNNVTVRNGNVRGMGDYGVYLLGTGNLVDGVHVDWTGSTTGAGFFVFAGVVTHCTATANAGTGFWGGLTGLTVSFSSATYNGGDGFNTASTVSNSIASSNGQDGIFDAFLALNNTSSYNKGLGLRFDGNGYGYMGNVMYGNSNFGGDVSSLGTSLGHNLCSSVAC